jgi:hypothetical protein
MEAWIMRKQWLCLAVSCALGLAAGPACRADEQAGEADQVRALAAKIDQMIEAKCKEAGVTPAPQADDAEFLRRLYLDLAGRIPPYSEVRDFLADASTGKRERVTEQLLESANYVRHFTNVWRTLLLPQNNNNPQAQLFLLSFDNWLRKRIRDNVPYDRLVTELLTSATQAGAPRRNMMAGRNQEVPVAFYEANERKPENLAASATRLFLGVKLECAQCHDHPHDKWTRNQFWEFAAFFSGIQPGNPNGGPPPVPDDGSRRSIKISGTGQTVTAHFLDGTEPKWKKGVQTRATLAGWMTAPDNQYFARTAANRVWAHFFGIGIVDPVDDLSETNPASHPELLDELARQLIAHKFDLKFLMRAITASKTYQRSSGSAKPVDPHLFARMAVRGMTAEQLYDSLEQATYHNDSAVTNVRFDPFGAGSPRSTFLAKFASQEKRSESQTTILQALTLMNGDMVGNATSIERSNALAAVSDAPFLDTAQRIETLYVVTLGRKPRLEEAEKLVKYVNSGGARGDGKAALTDIFWALLNSAEFMLNR